MKYVQDLYDFPHFYNYDNFYTILEKRSDLLKKVYNDEDIEIQRWVEYQTVCIYKFIVGKPHYVIVGTKIDFLPIYGHFLDNVDQFVYKRIYKSKHRDHKNNKFFKCQRSELCKPILGGWYRFDYIEDVFKQIGILQEWEYENRQERLKEDPYYTYNSDDRYGLITEYVNPNKLDFSISNQTIKIN